MAYAARIPFILAVALAACADDSSAGSTGDEASGGPGSSSASSSITSTTASPTTTTQGGDATATGDATTSPADGTGTTAATGGSLEGTGSSAGSSETTADGGSSSGSSGSGSETTAGAPCCDPAKAPICIEGTTCCDDGTWACKEGNGMPTCPAGEGEVCGGCAIQGASCVDVPCCGVLECCSGQPIPPGQAVCYPGVCPISDRNRKRAFHPVDPVAVLETVADLPISTWTYDFEPGDVRHMGPMAQDFSAAFGLGATDKAIFTIDADGVALASIQALHGELQRVTAQKAALEERVEDLEARLTALESSAR